MPQGKELKEGGEGRTDWEMDWWIFVVKMELSCKAKLSFYQSINVPILPYGHELWVEMERMRSRYEGQR